MDLAQFNEILDNTIKRVQTILGVKRDEYANEDVLRNFRQSAMLQGVSMPEALRGKMAKHTVSIYEMIGSGKPYPIEVWDEKIIDHINYLILLRAALIEGAQNPL